MLKTFSALFAVLVVSLTSFGEPPKAVSNELLLGLICPCSGPLAAMSKAVLDGANAGLLRANRAGGVSGRPIRIITGDDRYEPLEAVKQAHKLVLQDHVFSLISGGDSAGLHAMLPFLTEQKEPLLFPFTAAEFLYNPDEKLVYTMRPSFDAETTQLISYLVKSGHFKKIGIFYQNDVFGTSVRDIVSRALPAGDSRLVRSVGHERSENDHFEKGIEDFKKAGVDLIVFATNVIPAAAFVKEAEKLGLSPSYAGISTVGTLSLKKLIADSKSSFYVSEVLPLPTVSQLPIVKEFIEDYRGPKDDAMYALAFNGYVTARLFVEAAKLAGTNLTHDSLYEALNEKMKDFDLGGLKVSFGATRRQALKDIFIYELQQGAVRLVSR